MHDPIADVLAQFPKVQDSGLVSRNQDVLVLMSSSVDRGGREVGDGIEVAPLRIDQSADEGLNVCDDLKNHDGAGVEANSDQIRPQGGNSSPHCARDQPVIHANAVLQEIEVVDLRGAVPVE